MRVIHLVTLVTPQNDYGGPVRVAADQARELLRRGHDVTLLAAATSELVGADEYLGVPFVGFPARIPSSGKYAGVRASGLREWLRERRAEIELLHVHLARDLVTLPAARLAQRYGVPTVVQTHGMIVPRSDVRARVVDALWTRRVLRDGRVLFALSQLEKSQLAAVSPAADPAQVLSNGIAASPPVAATRTSGSPLDVLFLSRLHPRKRPEAFVRAASLVDIGEPVVFSVVGPDEGSLDAVRRAASETAATVRIEGPLAPDRVSDRMARADVFVLPARDEPFGMVVLEAMLVGTPVVINRSGGLADVVEREGAGIVVDGSEASIARAVQRLLSDPGLRRRMGAAGQRLSRRFTITDVTDTLESVYASASMGRQQRT